MTPALRVVTPCIRPQNLPRLACSLESAARLFALRWQVVYDLSQHTIPHEWVERPPFLEETASDIPAWRHPFGERLLNDALADLPPDCWLWQLADDNLAQPGFAEWLRRTIDLNPAAGAVVFRQDVAPGVARHAFPENVRPGLIDAGQFVVRGDLVGDERYRDESGSDARFIERLHRKAPERFVFVNEAGLVSYNALRPGEGTGCVPGRGGRVA